MNRLKKLACLAAALVALALPPAAPANSAKNPPKADQAANAPVDDKTLQTAVTKGLPLDATINVAEQASVEAVLIPASVAQRIFGKEVAHNYAVVELVVSNKDSKAGLIVQSVFLDYSHWLLSGIPSPLPKSNTLENTQKANQPWQVASIESRLIRGELLDAQQWTARNWTIRTLTAVGSVAAGFQFPFSGGVAKGIAAFNGEVVPGVSNLWPDGTVNQINRITDNGFQTNKIIPKQASDIIVAFFPIDRFLTPTFHKRFVENPAGFFMPGELLADPKTPKEIKETVLKIAGAAGLSVDQNGLLAQMAKSLLATCETDDQKRTNDCKIQTVLTRISLNSVRVVIGGVMSVDVAAVPATIYQVSFNDGNTNTALWTTTGTKRTGTISGVYLSDGTPWIVDAKGNPIDGISIAADTANSTDTQLTFTMTITKCIPPTAGVYFVVSKPNATGSSTPKPATPPKTPEGVLSSPFLFALPDSPCPAGK